MHFSPRSSILVTGELPTDFLHARSPRASTIFTALLVWAAMNCVVTAGPTYEPLDDVRRLTNFSTGKLGSQLGDFLRFVRIIFLHLAANAAQA